MKEKITKAITLLDKIWFSDQIMKLFIIFPVGMWNVMVWISLTSYLEGKLKPTAIILFCLSVLITILLGSYRNIKDIVSKSGEGNQLE